MRRLLVIFLIVACLLSGCKTPEPAAARTPPSTEPVTAPPETTQPPTQTQPPETTQPPTQPEPEPDPIAQLMETMTLEEKVGQLFFARCPGENATADAQTYQLGGYLLFAGDFEGKTADQIRERIQGFQSVSKIPMLIGVDEEGGTVVRVSSNKNLRESKFRSPQKLYAEGGMERIVEDTKEKDALLKSLGINVNCAPVADVSTNSSDFIHSRSFGQDAQATADFTAQVVAQMGRDQIGSTLKHFPGYGSNVDTHTGIARDTRSMETFLTADLLPFRSHSAGEGTAAIMVSHNIMCCVDTEFPASLSAKVHGFLREVLPFDGVVMTDGLDMGAVKAYAEGGNIALTALQAGNDMLLLCSYKTGIPAILEAVEDGTVTEEMIDTACYRVLSWKQSLGLI